MNTPSISERRVREPLETEHAEGTRRVARTPDELYRCENAKDPNEQARICGTSPDAKTTLFAKQSGDADEISPDDVAQWQIGDCYLHAAMMALASTPQGRAQIKSMISENRDAHGNLLSYTVRFYENGAGTKPREITVDTQLPTAGLARARATGDASEIWPLVIEKAYAKTYGQYANIHGGWPSDALAKLTGCRSRDVDPSKADAFDTVKRARENGKAVIFGTVEHPPSPLVGSHAYLLDRIAKDAHGNDVVVLKNPWGNGAPTVTVPVSKWKSAFSIITTT